MNRALIDRYRTARASGMRAVEAYKIAKFYERAYERMREYAFGKGTAL